MLQATFPPQFSQPKISPDIARYPLGGHTHPQLIITRLDHALLEEKSPVLFPGSQHGVLRIKVLSDYWLNAHTCA